MTGGNFHRFFVNALTFSRVPFILVFMAAAVAGEHADSCALKLVACAAMLSIRKSRGNSARMSTPSA